jgi:LPS O-antigen subunit length determinant protein (WzzB/FepE family)
MDEEQQRITLYRLLELRDNADEKEIWNEFLFDFYHRNLRDYLCNQEKYWRKKQKKSIKNNHQDFVLQSTFHYNNCGICADEEKLNKKGLCDDCSTKFPTYLIMYKKIVIDENKNDD